MQRILQTITVATKISNQLLTLYLCRPYMRYGNREIPAYIFDAMKRLNATGTAKV
jgi:hypothetical protein